MKLQSCEKVLKKLLIFLLLLLYRTTAWTPQEHSRQESKLVIRLEHVLNLILTRTCAENNMSIFLSTEYSEELQLREQRLVERVLGKVLRRHSLEAQVPIVMDRKLQSPLNLQVQLMLFFVEDTQQFMRSVIGNAGATATHKHKILVVMLAKRGDETETHKEMSQIFSYMLLERYNTDVLIILAQLQLATLRIYTFFPFGRECESIEPVILPLQQAHLAQLYPPKLHNLLNCPLHVIVWQIPPYIEVQPDFQSFQGWDAQLLKLLARKLNFQVVLVPNDPPHLFGGESHMNGTFTGAYGMLRERRANLTLGCTACQLARSKYLSNSGSYNQMEYIIVLREGDAYSYYEIMLFPFKSSTWLLLLFLVLLRFLYRFTDEVIADFFAPLPAPVHLGWIMLLFVLRIGYEGSIFKFVHNAPVRPLPQSLEQALLQDYSFIMDQSTRRMIAPLPALDDRSRVLPGRAVDMFEQFLRLPENSRTGLLTSRDFLAYHLFRHREQRNRFVILERKLLNNIVCMHLPLGSYLTRIIGQLLFDLRSFGICQQLTKLPSWATASSTTSSRARPLTEAPKDHLAESMHFLQAAVYGLLFAESLILCIFLLELLSLHPQFHWLNWFFHRL
ncbi:uncharacterized protein LOC117784372 [Drosophila innubila]|uniref:uncharacterized protein LOC117784372 n=1 Tax=Drosophila innubila TaxID=198719 RepID=UPI00148E6B1E|nr:uncharacterized protein LOC117784372 [Drosophila innubila]